MFEKLNQSPQSSESGKDRRAESAEKTLKGLLATAALRESAPPLNESGVIAIENTSEVRIDEEGLREALDTVLPSESRH